MGDQLEPQPEASGVSLNTASSKKKKDGKRSAKRDSRSWENVLKSVAHLSDPEKIVEIGTKYKEIFNELRSSNTTLKSTQRHLASVQKEKEHVHTELTKNILSRSKMENICRELQKQNKDIKEENYNRLKEEEEKRREVAASFSSKLTTLATLMDDNKDKSVRLREENLNMTAKLTELHNQFQERETHLANMNSQMELQKKLADTQIKKMEVEFEAERSMWHKERAILVDNLGKSDETNKVLQNNVKTLQEHLNTYQKQYSDFESTMKRSNEVFDTFKEEIAKMQKSNSNLEKDRNEWHQRWQTSTQTIVHLTELHQQAVSEHVTTQKKVDMLVKLCRKLNVERSSYIAQLKENNIDPKTPTMPEEESAAAPAQPEPVRAHTPGRKWTPKEKELVALRNELQMIEEQILQSTERTPLQQGSSRIPPTGEEQFQSQQLAEQCKNLQHFFQNQQLLSQTNHALAKQLPKRRSAAKAKSEIKIPKASTSSATATTSSESFKSELSTGAVPLNKATGVTDLTQQVDAPCLVNITSGHMNLYDPDSVAGAAEDILKAVEKEPSEPALATIPLYKGDATTSFKSTYHFGTQVNVYNTPSIVPSFAETWTQINVGDKSEPVKKFESDAHKNPIDAASTAEAGTQYDAGGKSNVTISKSKVNARKRPSTDLSEAEAGAHIDEPVTKSQMNIHKRPLTAPIVAEFGSQFDEPVSKSQISFHRTSLAGPSFAEVGAQIDNPVAKSLVNVDKRTSAAPTVSEAGAQIDIFDETKDPVEKIELKVYNLSSDAPNAAEAELQIEICGKCNEPIEITFDSAVEDGSEELVGGTTIGSQTDSSSILECVHAHGDGTTQVTVAKGELTSGPSEESVPGCDTDGDDHATV